MNQERIWQHFQNESPEVFRQGDGRIRFLAREIIKRVPKGAPVLNVGIGEGLFENLARQGGLVVHSLDPDAQAIARLGVNGFAQVGHLESLPFEQGKFAAVVVSEVLEHLSADNLARGLAEVHRVLSPKGVIIGTVPSNEQLAYNVVLCPGCGEKFHRWGHQQSFDQKRLHAVLSERFKVLVVREKFLAPWIYLDWKGKTVCAVKNSMLRLGFSWPGASLYFVAVKSEAT
jgi:SAM-dependent methyltransferase